MEAAGETTVEERLREYEELFKYRYTRRDPDYNSTVLRASNPAPPPVMANWPPVSRGRRPWRPPRRDNYQRRSRYHDNRNLDYEEVLEVYSRSKRQRLQQSYHDMEEKSTEDVSTTVTMTTTDDSDGVVTSPPIATGGKEKPHKGGHHQGQQQQQQHVMSHFVPFSEAAIGMGLAENPVAPSENDVKAILSYASAATETRKDASRGIDKQPAVAVKQAKSEELNVMTIPSHKQEPHKKTRKKRKTKSHEEEPVVAANLLPQNLLPADLIEQEEDEGEAAPVVQVSKTKLIIRTNKVVSPAPEPHPVVDDATTSTKKTTKKKKKKDKTQHNPLKLKLKVGGEDTPPHIVPQ